MPVIESRASLMNAFIKYISLILSAVLLVACGSSSSDSSKVTPYSLDGYQNRIVSSDSLVGTWVSVSEWQAFQFYYDIYRDYLVAKEYFVITENDGVYEKTSCDIDTSSFVKSYDDLDTSINVNSENHCCPVVFKSLNPSLILYSARVSVV